MAKPKPSTKRLASEQPNDVARLRFNPLLGRGYGCVLADPPWPQELVGRYRVTRHKRPDALPYATLTVDEIAALPVSRFAADSCHLWLWTTNQFLRTGFAVMDAWGFRFLAPVTWVKPSGLGAWFVHRTQTLLFGYRGKLTMRERYRPTVLFANPVRHSRKPDEAYELIEAVSHGPRLELFAREHRDGWNVWGNEVESDVHIAS